MKSANKRRIGVQKLARNVRKLAKICVNFSVKGGGTYEVDFTKRNNVKITSGANVNYINFTTILVTKHD